MKRKQLQSILTETERRVNESRGTTEFSITLHHFKSTFKSTGDEATWSTVIDFNDSSESGWSIMNSGFATSEESLLDIVQSVFISLINTFES